MNHLLMAILLLVSLVPTASRAEEVAVTASNGVVVKVSNADFSSETTFTAPAANNNGVAFLVTKSNDKTMPYIEITGIIDYSSNRDWGYNAARFKSGAEAPVVFYNREVAGCSGICSRSDFFGIPLSRAQIAPFLKLESFEIKFFGTHSNADNPVITVPVKYLTAVLEVAARN